MQLYQDRLRVVEVCTDDLPLVASDAGVVSIPTIQLYYKGQLKDTIVGCVSSNVLTGCVEKMMEDIVMEKGGDDDTTTTTTTTLSKGLGFFIQYIHSITLQTLPVLSHMEYIFTRQNKRKMGRATTPTKWKTLHIIYV
mmetsp:Transcript_29050/g.41081  ORF Transcript_29050/g.41081 Transcript_29050/m.41081 type:complete len:138 (-) Transcript_29050:202-615(-)